MFDIIERIAIHEKAIKELVELTDTIAEKEKCSTQINIVQAMINGEVEKRISKLEDNNVLERLDHMEEYLDKLTKRIKSLEK